MKKIPFTKVGYEDLLAEKKQLEGKRVSAVKELSIARDMGDRSENAFYKTARQKLSGIDRRLREINRLLKMAIVVEPTHKGIVEIGSNVTVSDSEGESQYFIVGSHESDLARGRLSSHSPLGASLLGKKAGDTVTLNLPKGIKTIRVETVS